MIKLDRYDTVRLLITKGWQHKDIPKGESESIFDYSRRIFSVQCGVDLSHMTNGDVAHIWTSFASEIFSLKDFRQYMELTALKQYEPLQAIITIIQLVKVVGRFELDESDIKK